MKLQWLMPILIFLSFSVGAPEARSQLLFSGGEDVDFTCQIGGSCNVTTTSNVFRPAWAREAYEVSGTTSDPPTNRFATPAFPANSTLWIHAQYCNDHFGCNDNNNTNTNEQMLRVFDSAGNPALVVLGTGTNGQLAIASRNASGAFTTLVTCSSVFNISLTQIDLFINYATAGEVSLYSNSTRVCDFTGDVTNGDGATTLDQLEFSAPSGWLAGWSEIIVATSDTRAMSRFTANTVNNGNTTGFSGTNICSSIWNATSFNDNNYGYSGSPNVLHECTINSSFPGGDFVVMGIVMSARALVGATGPQHFDFVTRTGGADYTSPDFAPTQSFSNIQNYIQTVNPATSNPWAISDFTATGFNVGEETKP